MVATLDRGDNLLKVEGANEAFALRIPNAEPDDEGAAKAIIRFPQGDGTRLVKEVDWPADRGYQLYDASIGAHKHDVTLLFVIIIKE